MSLQIRYIYTKGPNRVLGEWCWVTDGEYYYPHPGMTGCGWTVAIQARETDNCPPPKPKRTDHNRKWRRKEKRAIANARPPVVVRQA